MSYFPRSSPKLRLLSCLPSALALTAIPGAAFCCARAINSVSPLGSGLNREEFRVSTPANKLNRMTVSKMLRSQELIIMGPLLPQLGSQWSAACSQGLLLPSRRGHLEDVIAPGWQVEVESLGHEVITVAIVDGRAGQVVESHCAPRKVFKRKMN